MKRGEPMTKGDAMKVLAILQAAYQKNMTKEQARGTVAIWCMQFADIPLDVMLMAVNKHISTSEFFPKPSEIKKKLEAIYWEAYDAITQDSVKLPPEALQQYQRIYDITRAYKFPKMAEPTLKQMLSNTQMLQLGSGE